jgi:predicted hotdog family 3-hydroxylacyl-ACP dehydratase
MAGLMQKGPQSPAIRAGLLQANVKALAHANTLEPAQQFLLALGAPDKHGVLTRSLRAWEITEVALMLGDIDANGAAEARQGSLGSNQTSMGSATGFFKRV